MSETSTCKTLWSRIHRDQSGSVSLETILILGAIALPVLIFILKFGWPRIRDYFNERLTDTDHEVENVTSGTGN